jgi:hypothetical protein
MMRRAVRNVLLSGLIVAGAWSRTPAHAVPLPAGSADLIAGEKPIEQVWYYHHRGWGGGAVLAGAAIGLFAGAALTSAYHRPYCCGYYGYGYYPAYYGYPAYSYRPVYYAQPYHYGYRPYYRRAYYRPYGGYRRAYYARPYYGGYRRAYWGGHRVAYRRAYVARRWR